MPDALRNIFLSRYFGHGCLCVKILLVSHVEGQAVMPHEQGEDDIDGFRLGWARELPDVDTEPMAVFGRVHRLAHLLRPGIEATFERVGLDRGEFDVLATLRRSGPPYSLTPTEIYTSLLISSGGLTHRLGRLEAAGLIRRERSSQDGRSLVVTLTARGTRKTEEAFRADMEDEAAALRVLSARERQSLAGLLRKLVRSLENAGAEHARDEGG